jgi:transcriptional regulator with XRE-family HTH domain
MDKEVLRALLIGALRQIRLDAQLTQADLALRLKKPQSFVSKYENGERRLDIVELYEICLALNTSLSGFNVVFEELIRTDIRP